MHSSGRKIRNWLYCNTLCIWNRSASTIPKGIINEKNYFLLSILNLGMVPVGSIWRRYWDLPRIHSVCMYVHVWTRLKNCGWCGCRQKPPPIAPQFTTLVTHLRAIHWLDAEWGVYVCEIANLCAHPCQDTNCGIVIRSISKFLN